MIARLIVFKPDGSPATHQLSFRVAGTGHELKLVLQTDTQHFETWLFFFLRDHGARIETTDPDAIARALNLPPGEAGIVRVNA